MQEMRNADYVENIKMDASETKDNHNWQWSIGYYNCC